MTERIVVVGGGLVGTATAYFAAREGLSVTLLEQQAVGYGASGRNPGFVWLHCRNPGWALEVSMAGRRLYDDLVRDLPVPFEFRAEGGLIYFTTPEQGRVFEEFVARRRDDGLDMELIDGAEVRRQVGPIRPDVLGASFCADDAQINTPTVVAALAAGARAEGADVREGVTVTALARAGDRVVGVETDAGPIEADMVVVATGVWTQQLLADTGRRGAGGHGAACRSSPPCRCRCDIQPVVYGPLAAKQYACSGTSSWDEPAFLGAVRDRVRPVDAPAALPAANGEVLLGCPMDYPPEVTHQVTLSGLRDTATAIGEDFPGLRDVAIDRMWAGVLPYTSDLVPIIDEVTPGLFVAAGHVFGNASGPMTGKLVAQLLLGKEPDVDMTECRWGRDLEPIAPGASVHW